MKPKADVDPDLAPEYDFRGARRGRHAARYAAGTNLVALAPDVATAFPSSEAVNGALRTLLAANAASATGRSHSAGTTLERKSATAVYIERRPSGDYAVRRPGSARAAIVTATQSEAISRARKLAPDTPILVERVRHTGADKWRKA